jgi:hypothetical protein
MNLIQETINKLLPSTRKNTSGGWISFNAVCCHHRGERMDDKQRGGIKIEKDGFVYHCFNCGFAAGWQPPKQFTINTKKLFEYLNVSAGELDKLSFESTRPIDRLTNIDLPIVVLKPIELPEQSLPIVKWIETGNQSKELIGCIEYIFNRGLTLDDYNWHWTPAAGYKDRVLIPFYNDTVIVGYTGRKIKEGNPKYLTHSQNGYVFNIDAQTYDKKFVIVSEGQFDAISIGGVAIMHNDPNPAQCFKINSLRKEVIVVPDRDAAGVKMLEAAVKNGWSISMPPWGDDIKDISKAVEVYGKAYTLATILHYKQSNHSVGVTYKKTAAKYGITNMII